MNKQILKEKLEAKKALLCSPLNTLYEILESQKTTYGEFSFSMTFGCKLDYDKFKRFMSGNLKIDIEIAKALEQCLETPASFWLNLQTNYENELKEIKELENELNK